MASQIDPTELDVVWEGQWPNCRPISYEMRFCASSNWVRFHSLPESKQYPETDIEYSEMLSRHNTIIDHLLSTGTEPVAEILVVTAAWSSSPTPTPRNPRVAELRPRAQHWQSIMEDSTEDDESWTHLFAEMAEFAPGNFDPLLALTADDQTANVILAPPNFAWLYLPYDGGVDVIARSSRERDELKETYQAWLPVN